MGKSFDAHVYALEAAKEITIARMSNVNVSQSKTTGEDAAAFYESVYRKVLGLAKEAID